MNTPAALRTISGFTAALAAILRLAGTAHAVPDGFAQQVLRDTPAAYWRLGEAPGTRVARDSSCAAEGAPEVNPGHCTTNNGSYFYPGIQLHAPGVSGGDTGAQFDGTRGYVAVPPFPASAPLGGVIGDPHSGPPFFVSTLSPGVVTMEAVIRWDGATAAPSGSTMYQRIIEKSAFDEQAIYGLSINNHDGRVLVELTAGVRYPAAVPAPQTLLSKARLRRGQEVHLVATYDGRVIRLYINGVLNASTPRPLDPPQALQAGSPIMGIGIGNQVLSDDILETNEVRIRVRPRPFNGLIDEVALYDHVLTPARIQAHARAAGVFGRR